MELNEYQKASRKTLPYLAADSGLAYLTLGLAGEAGELLEKAFHHAPVEDLMGGVGDVLWCLAQIATEVGLELESLKAPTDRSVKRAAARNAVESISKGHSQSLADLCSLLVVNVAAVSECTKKMLRDDQGVLTPERQEKFSQLLSDVLLSWHLAAQRAGIEPGVCAAANCEKLASRQQRGVLGGSGDNR